MPEQPCDASDAVRLIALQRTLESASPGRTTDAEGEAWRAYEKSARAGARRQREREGVWVVGGVYVTFAETTGTHS